MSSFRLQPDLALRAVASARLDFLGRVGTDLATIGTWDPRLSRRTRILVPVDVQAFVSTGAEPTVDLTGADGDPAPFADGAPRPAGVHLHWALPDALLAATHTDGATQPTMADLPDAWVVVRTLQPVGGRQVVPTGWVIDARTGVVTPLPSYVGAADVSQVPDAITPLTGARFGLMAIGSYHACVDHFAFHDPLDDLGTLTEQAPGGFAGQQAVYTVAGWWSDESQDPLHAARGPAGLDAALSALGWYVEHDANDDDVAEPDTRTARSMSRYGLVQPQEKPAPRVFGSDGRTVTGRLTGVSYETAYPVDAMRSVRVGDGLPTYHALLHGSVLGVPIDGALPGADDRPAPDGVSIAAGGDTDDVAAAFGTAGLDLGDDARELAEDALEAFVMGTSTLLGTPDGLDELAVREHTQGFWSFPGAPVPGSNADRLRVQDTLAAGPTTVGRKGRGDVAAARSSQAVRLQAKGKSTGKSTGRTGAAEVSALAWKQTFDLQVETTIKGRERISDAVRRPPRVTDQGRTVPRPSPRYHRPAPLVLALRGAHPSHRHHGDGLFDAQGRLLCRYPRSAVPSWDGVVDGSVVLPSLGSGAIPPEVTTVVREAVLLNPYGGGWLAAAGAPPKGAAQQYQARIAGEMVRLYGTEGRYDGTAGLSLSVPKSAKAAKAAAGGWGEVRDRMTPEVQQITAELARFSTLRGMPPSPVALTTWRQPWVPLWLEWEATLTGTSTLRGWSLDGYDLEQDPDAAGGDPVTVTVRGRSPLGQGVGRQVQAAVKAWLDSESQRAVTNRTDPYSGQDVLSELGALGVPLDLLSASLDGVREQLLGIAYVGQVPRDETGTVVAAGPATPLFGGTLRLDRLRVVDAFGRLLDLPDAALDATVTTLPLDAGPRTLRLRPRLQHSARWLLRLTHAAQPPGTAPESLQEANVDELDPTSALNPVAGFLLPDHIDESLESFTVAGTPLGEMGHDPITGAVTWEPAPGRAVRADAGPLEGIELQDRLVAEVAAGLVRADAAARALPPEQRPADSALVNLLRAVDTTLWTVDTFATIGSGTVAGLVGRPIAVVRAALRLDLPDDLAEVHTPDPAARKAAFDALGDELVEVKLGTLTRSDDALLGYFVDDDYEHLHLVDKVVAGNARLSGRLVGQLGLLGTDVAPPTTTLSHPYLVADGVLRVRPRQTTMLTLLLLPMGKVHVTSGLLPRKEIALADSWTAAGLKRLVPSVRVGPLLVDPAEIRLPLVSILGDKQTFTRRTGELTWKDDPIVAATETAYLPRLPHQVQEGWIRVTPAEEEGS